MLVSFCCVALSLTLPQLNPNRSEEIDSAIIDGSSAIVQIMHVLQLPLSESLRSIVKDDSLKGGCVLLFLDLMARMHLPRVVRLWFIFLASSALILVAPLLLIRSEPARSTKRNLDCLRDLPFV